MRKPALILALTFASLVVASACGGGFDPTLRVTLEMDTTPLPPGQDLSEVLDDVKDVVERRLDAFGASGKVTVEGENLLIVETSGMTADEAEDLIGRTGLLRFMEAEEDEDRIICRTEEGERFSAHYPGQVAFGLCTTAELFGEVVWKPAFGTRDGQVLPLTGRQVQAGSARAETGPADQPQVQIEFTDTGAVLFEQITARLSSPPRPLGIFLDDDLITAPQVNFVIASSEVVISGIGSLDEAKSLAIILSTGAPAAPISIIAIEEIP